MKNIASVVDSHSWNSNWRWSIITNFLTPPYSIFSHSSIPCSNNLTLRYLTHDKASPFPLQMGTVYITLTPPHSVLHLLEHFCHLRGYHPTSEAISLDNLDLMVRVPSFSSYQGSPWSQTPVKTRLIIMRPAALPGGDSRCGGRQLWRQGEEREEGDAAAGLQPCMIYNPHNGIP